MRPVMPRRCRLKPALAAAALLLSGSPLGAAMKVGVNTHFEQGWPLAAFARVAESGAQGIRDGVIWGKVEKVPGRYDFTPRNSGHVDVACRKSVPVLLVVGPRNNLYDGGQAVASPAGQRALARYIGALVDRFPCVIAVEIGNEINTASSKWPGQAAKPAMYVSMLRAIRQELNGHKRKVALVGGSSLGVAPDFHARLFNAGELPLIDAVAVHPYTNQPERISGALDQLRTAMQKHGQVKPVWATEFGNYYKTPEAAPPHALKVFTLMSAAGVQYAWWYALLDEPWYPNMGLYRAAGPKPALATYRTVVQKLLPAGNARRLPSDDPSRFVYRFGNGPYVLWGRGPLHLPAGARVFDASGRAVPAPAALGPDPIIVVTPLGRLRP